MSTTAKKHSPLDIMSQPGGVETSRRAERKDRVVIRLMGGLGNQMFQYAFGRRLAAAECDVRFDAVNGFAGDFYGRKFALDRFRAHLELASPEDIPAGMRLVPPWHRIAKAAWLAVPPRWRSVVYEREIYR